MFFQRRHSSTLIIENEPLDFYLQERCHNLVESLNQPLDITDPKSTRIPLFLLSQISSSIQQIRNNTTNVMLTENLCNRIAFLFQPVPNLINRIISVNRMYIVTLDASKQFFEVLLNLVESYGFKLEEKKIVINVLMSFLTDFCKALHSQVEIMLQQSRDPPKTLSTKSDEVSVTRGDSFLDFDKIRNFIPLKNTDSFGKPRKFLGIFNFI